MGVLVLGEELVSHHPIPSCFVGLVHSSGRWWLRMYELRDISECFWSGITCV